MPSTQQQSSRVALYNRTVVLDLIRRYGPISKSELAERSGLAVSSVVNVLGTLTRRGLVRSVGLGPSTGGRPPSLVELEPGARYAVGANIHRAGVEAVLLNLTGDVVAETSLPLQGGLDVESVTTTVAEAVVQVARLGDADPGRVLGVGVGCPGPVKQGRVVVCAPALYGWRDVPLADRLEGMVGLPVTLENDANLCALAEFRHGAGHKGSEPVSLIYVYVDHGVGQGVVLDGNLLRGADGLAGELGHTVVDVNGPLCACGAYGCLETLASIDSIIERVVRQGKLGGSTVVGERVGGDWDAVGFAAVLDAICEGDVVASQALDSAISYLVVGIRNAVLQVRPHAVVVGGGLFSPGSPALERLQAAWDARALFFDTPNPPLLLSQIGAQAAAIGGATLILDTFFGVPQQVMHAQGREASEPAFEQAPVWPDQADLAVALVRSDAMVAWAGNLQPASARLAAGEQVAVTVDVRLKPGSAAADANRVKVLLHWDRVPQFGGNWPKPKNSPMHLVAENGEVSTYAVTLGSLPPGKYEFAAHVLGANELWARTDTPNETNGRIEILDPRVVSSNGDGPIEGITESTMAHRQPGKIGLSAAVDAGSATGSLD